MSAPLWTDLIFDLDRACTSLLEGANGVVHVDGVAETRVCVDDDW